MRPSCYQGVSPVEQFSANGNLWVNWLSHLRGPPQTDGITLSLELSGFQNAGPYQARAANDPKPDSSSTLPRGGIRHGRPRQRCHRTSSNARRDVLTGFVLQSVQYRVALLDVSIRKGIANSENPYRGRFTSCSFSNSLRTGPGVAVSPDLLRACSASAA